MKRSVGVIGAGFSGLAASCCLAKENFNVSIYEKNAEIGGRARRLVTNGFVFDMGPSWYWMPDVFERFFNRFGSSSSDFYSLKRLDPSYRVFFAKDDYLDIPAGEQNVARLFDQLEPGSGKRLCQFLKEAKYKYQVGMQDLVYKPGLSFGELLDLRLIRGALHLHIFKSFSSHLKKFFRNDRIIRIMQFPVLFLGTTPDQTPALYSLMNYADISLGTWYPMGGMYKIIEAMKSLSESLGVRIFTSTAIDRLETVGGKVKGLHSNSHFYEEDYVIASADYHHVEQSLLPSTFRCYNEKYWNTRMLAPSALIFYLGVKRKLDKLQHHNLFFDEEFDQHADEIYKNPRWPTAPQFYVSCPSRTDRSVAPDGCENVMILIPTAAGLADDESVREKYFQIALSRLESVAGEDIRNHIVFRRSYAHNDFVSDYNAFRGNAYGLANTLTQTANLRPSIVNKRLPNLFYTGQLTVPGPGMPPAIISGQVVAAELLRRAHKTSTHSLTA